MQKLQYLQQKVIKEEQRSKDKGSEIIKMPLLATFAASQKNIYENGSHISGVIADFFLRQALDIQKFIDIDLNVFQAVLYGASKIQTLCALWTVAHNENYRFYWAPKSYDSDQCYS